MDGSAEIDQACATFVHDYGVDADVAVDDVPRIEPYESGEDVSEDCYRSEFVKL